MCQRSPIITSFGYCVPERKQQLKVIEKFSGFSEAFVYYNFSSRWTLFVIVIDFVDRNCLGEIVKFNFVPYDYYWATIFFLFELNWMKNYAVETI